MNARTAKLWRTARFWAGLTMLVWLTLGPLLASAATDPARAGSPSVGRPKIGLVLAGGGAKGAAHVGVLKVIEELHIPIDFVVGTSMGSIVGGLYASGMKPDEIEAAIKSIDWTDVFVDNPERADRSFRRKTDDALYLFKARPGIGGDGIKLPLAVVQGQKFDLQLNRLTRRVAGVHDFDQLPIPFRAVAADLETGAEVVLKSGDLARAIRASMAVPGAFTPVEIGGKLLVDGGIANNIPVSVARAMGADVLIVSELGTDMLTREQIKSGIDVAAQMVGLLFVINSRQQLATLGPDDVRVSVNLGDIGAGSFGRIREAIPLGEQAARKVQDRLGHLAVSEGNYQRHVAGRPTPRAAEQPIDFVRIDNQSRVSDAVIASQLHVESGKPLDLDQLERDIQQIYGLEIFESVRYSRIDEGERSGLVVHTREKSWGPGYLETGLITSSNFEGDSAIRLGLGYTRTALNALNGEWRTALQIGDEPGLYTELFQPFDPGARYFGFARAAYETRNVNTFDSDGDKLSELHVRGPGVSFGAGRQFGTWGEARLGWLRRAGTIKVAVGEQQPERDFDTGEVFLSLTDDKLDSLYFPHSGHFGRVEWRASRDAFGADSNFEQANAAFQLAHTWGRDTLLGGLMLKTTFDGTAPVQSLHNLGGFLRLSGFEEGRLSGQQAGLGRLVYMHRLNDIQQLTAYAGGSLEMGNVWKNTSDIFSHDNIFAGSLFVGADTPLGPLYFAYGRNDSGAGSIYLYLGPLFSF